MPAQTLTISPYGIDADGQAYLPNPAQEYTLRWVDNIRAQSVKDMAANTSKGVPVLYLQGGVGAGKTRALLAPALEMLFEIPSIRMLWGRQDFNDLRVSAMETFFEALPTALLAGQNIQESRYEIKQNGGTKATIFFKGLKDLGGLGSQEFAVIVVTEAHEISEQAFRTLKMRACRQKGKPGMILMEGNPPNKGHWLDRYTDPSSHEFDSDIEIVKVSTLENWDNLNPAYRASLQKMPEAWKHKYLTGEFGFMPAGTPFYQGFVESLHVADVEFMPDREVYVGWDFGYHHPAVVFSQIDNNDRMIILDEILGDDILIQDFWLQKVRPRINRMFSGATIKHVGDPACMQKSDKSELTTWEILRDMGVYVYHRPSDYRLRKEVIEGKLNLILHGKPSILVHKRCRNIIEGFLGGYHYPEHKQDSSFTPAHETPFRDGWYEHIMNAMEYIFVNTFGPIKTQPTKRSREVRKPRPAIVNNI